jgi:peptidoglycan/LPS O-acetylase OafA/YrhL
LNSPPENPDSNAASPPAGTDVRPTLPFRPDIEGLRALAILFVVFSHAGVPLFSSGFIGVDIFFVLSGYLITSLLLVEVETTHRLDFARFYARRARRLLPAAMLLVLVVCLVEAIVVSPIQQYRVLKASLVTLFYSSNIYFAHIDLHYFEQESAVNPLLHTWSLAVEEQFYLVWPILLLVLTRIGKSRRTVAIALATLAAISFAYCIWLTRVIPSAAFFGSPARAWEFCAGALLSFLPASRLGEHKRIFSIFGPAGLGAAGLICLLACAQFTSAQIFPGFVALFPVLGSAAVLIAGAASPGSIVPRLLGARPAQLFGRLSYSLYLWHWSALVIAQQLFPSGALGIRLAALAAALLLAVVTHFSVENPIRFSPYLAARSALILKLAAATALIIACALFGWRFEVVRSAPFQKFNRALSDIPKIYALGCVPGRPDPQPRICTLGETKNPQSTVVLFGDSHAAEWFPALDQIAESQHWKLVTLVKPGCTPLDIPEEISPFMERVCTEWRSLSIARIQQIHPNLVIVSSASLHPVAGGRMITDAAVWQRAAHDTFAALAQQGAPVRFMRDTPHADFNVLECLAQSEWDGRTHCPSIDPATALYPEIFAAEERGAAGFGNVGFIDMSDRMCNARECFPEVGGVVVYRDNDHLTATFNRGLAPTLYARLKESLTESLGRK